MSANDRPSGENQEYGAEARDLIGSEWDDRDHREAGRRIQVVAILPTLDDGHGGPVYRCVTIASRQPWKIGRRTQIGHHGLLRRWRISDAPREMHRSPEDYVGPCWPEQFKS